MILRAHPQAHRPAPVRALKARAAASSSRSEVGPTSLRGRSSKEPGRDSKEPHCSISTRVIPYLLHGVRPTSVNRRSIELAGHL